MNQNPHSSERRLHPRLDGSIPLKISSPDFDFVTETQNLSRTGVYCRVSRYIEPMTKLKIHLLLPFKRKDKITTKKVTCSGVIVRSEAIAGKEDFNVAIYFNDIQGREADYISDYINTFLKVKTAPTP